MAGLEILSNEGEHLPLERQEVADLAASLRGSLITPADAAYDEARRLWNGMVDKRPALIVKATGPEDVVAAVRFAAKRNVKLSARGGGHNVAGHAMADGGLTIDLSAMRSVTVDADARRATVQAGATLGDVDRATHAHGLAVPVGLQSFTGIAGLTLHGGAGWLSRRHGLTLDNVTAVEIVTADGERRWASAEENEDLFWAVRGGGGNFGVITAFEYQLHPVGPEAFLNLLAYPLEDADEVLLAFRDFAASAPEEYGLIALMWTASGPEFPQEAQGAPVLILVGTHTGPPEVAEQQQLKLEVRSRPLAEIHTSMPFLELQSMFDAEYPDGRLYYWKSIYIDRLDSEVAAVLHEHARRRPSRLSSVDIWFLDGAVHRVPPGATAFAQRSAPFLIGIEANWDDPADSEANIAWTREAFAAMQPFSGGGMYLNFPGLAGEADALLRATFGENFERLQEVKASYDPTNLFRGNFNIKPKGRGAAQERAA